MYGVRDRTGIGVILEGAEGGLGVEAGNALFPRMEPVQSCVQSVWVH